MARDYSLEIRKQTVKCLQAYAPLTALVSVARIYGEEAPADAAWPFIRYGLALSEGFDATGWSGSQGQVTIHAFQNGPYTDRVAEICRHIVDAIEGTWAAPADTGVVQLEWARTQFLRDSPATEASKYHGVVQFEIGVAG